MNNVYDLAIIGGGPAGATLCRILGNTFKILLIERRSLKEEYDGVSKSKPCGGLVSNNAQVELKKMNLELPSDTLVNPQLSHIKAIDLKTEDYAIIKENLFNVNREKFDRWLFGLIPNSVNVCTNSVYVTSTKQDDFFDITFKTKGQEYKEKVRCIVGADGAASRVRKQYFRDEAVPAKYIGIEQWFETDNEIDPFFIVAFGGGVTDYYSWIIPKDNKLLVGSALQPGKNTKRRFQALIDKFRYLGYNLTNVVKSEGHPILRPRALKELRFSSQKGVFLIGEAAGLICPTSAEGYSYALASAQILAAALETNPNMAALEYEKKMSKYKTRIWQKNWKIPVIYNDRIRRMMLKLAKLK